MLTYRYLTKILNNKEIFRIFENVSDCVLCKTKPLFWLQFAIARTSNKDYDEALINFETSYALANEIPNYNKYQIDTHYAHYLLSRSIDLGLSDRESPFVLFEEVHMRLINRRKSDESRHYIYKVARDYARYFELFKDKMSPIEIVRFKKYSNEVHKMAEIYLTRKDASEKEMVRDAMMSLETILA